MNLFKSILTCGLLLFLAIRISDASEKPSKEEALALLTRAHESVSIRSEGPLILKATIKYEREGHTFAGEYQLFWLNEKKWREQINVGDFQDLRIGGDGIVWQQISHPQYRFIGAQIRNLLNFESDLKLNSNEVFKSVSEEKHNKEKYTCVHILTRKLIEREVCIEPLSNALLGTSESQTLSDFRKFGKRVFPFSLELDSGVRLKVIELSLVADFEPSLFTVPQNASRNSGCYFPEPPQFVERPHPTYPELARMERITGRVEMLVTITPTGEVKSVDLVWGHKALVGAVEDAIKKTKYLPATCNGTPVEGTTVHVSTFTMSR